MTDGTPAGELSRLIHVRSIPIDTVRIEASEEERGRLAQRFGLCAVHTLAADVDLEADGAEVRATGRLTAAIEQDCAVSGQPFATAVDEPIDLLFVPETAQPAAGFDEEIELAADELDRIAFAGDSFDLGEAVAQTLGLAIDPYAEGPDADAARAKAGIVTDDAPAGPLAAALAGLKLP